MSTRTRSAGWSVVLPVKDPRLGKSRLIGRSDALPEAIAVDTIAAVASAASVARVIVSTDWSAARRTLRPFTRTGRVVVRDDAPPGLNPAIQHGLALCRAVWTTSPVAAMVADLPGLNPAELDVLLGWAKAVERGAVADAEGTGTVLITAGPGIRLLPAFGGDSFAEHRARGHADLTDVAGMTLRWDVDGWEDLLGRNAVGSRTAAQLVRETVRERPWGPVRP